jgi:L-ascorbate metabolism protein UlaG (beta-lactamase superfamily)
MNLQRYETDTIETAAGPLEITFLGHGSLLFTFGGHRIYIDPFTQVANYTALPKADVILITHEHRDHLDPEAISALRTSSTEIFGTEACLEQIGDLRVMRNGETAEVRGMRVEAIPAYNLVHKRENGEPFHPSGRGNGYILTLGGRRICVAGDTENTPELKSLKDIDIAFLPMNVPYTMTPEMVADVAAAVSPTILYPYHFGTTDTSRLIERMKAYPDTEVRIRHLA